MTAPAVTWSAIPPHRYVFDCPYRDGAGGCYWCCEQCNFDTHTCPNCGGNVSHSAVFCASCRGA